MMDEMQPPSYEELPPGVAVCPAKGVNEGYIPDEAQYIKPPTAPPFEMPMPERLPVPNLDSLSEEELREACIQYASENCCYGKKFVRDTELLVISNGCTFHYQLETFGEKRESVDRTDPFIGQPIDGPENGPPPGPWDIPIRIPANFRENQSKCEIPHTAYVRECFRCVGNCRVRCSSCSGRGGSTCWSCSSTGRSNGRPCSSCSGSGRQRCWTCSGTGQVRCKTCDGKGRLKHYKLLVVTWKNHVESFITDTSKLPKKLILEVSGKEIFREENPRVFPITHAPDQTVNSASAAMIEKHSRAFPHELIRLQKHILRVIPLTKSNYSWKNKQGEFYVYGFEKKVFFQDYPQPCCCCTCL